MKTYNIEHEIPGASKAPRPALNPPEGRRFDIETMKLVHRLFLSPTHVSPSSVMFCGVDQGSGCSTVCALVADVLAAQVKGRICLVDANDTNPSLHRFFQIGNDRGFTNMLLDQGRAEDFAHQLPGRDLWVMPNGSAPADLWTLSDTEFVRSRVLELRGAFRHVIIDMPPASRYLDALVIGPVVDGVVLVIESDTTKREVARRTKESLEGANVAVLGAVLNKRKCPIPRFLASTLRLGQQGD
jgi:Mrp family chromosome partitioning ATPase